MFSIEERQFENEAYQNMTQVTIKCQHPSYNLSTNGIHILDGKNTLGECRRNPVSSCSSGAKGQCIFIHLGGLAILYIYELVMRVRANLWFPETWTMTRREAEGHSSRRGKLWTCYGPNHQFISILLYRTTQNVPIRNSYGE